MMASGLFAKKNFEESVREFASKGSRREINILTTGRLGTGKSAVVNSLIGEEVAPESDSLEQETLELKQYQRSIDMIVFNVWDTPGIEANSDEETKKFESIAHEVPEVDLLIFCTKMDETRLRKQDSDTILHFTKAFGEEIWKHTVFALTFANKVTPASHRKENPVEFFKRRLQLWTGELRKTLSKSEVSEETIEKVSIIPVSYKEQSLPDGSKEWLTPFWSACLTKMKESAQPALLKVNISRLKDAQMVAPEDYYLPIYRWPIIKDTLQKALVPSFGGVVLGTIAFFLCGPTGLAIGGTVGALAGYFYQEHGTWRR